MHSGFDEKTHKAFLARLDPSERAREDSRLRAYGRIELTDPGLRSQVFVSRYRLSGDDYRYVREDNSLGQGWTELHRPTHRPEGYKPLPEAFIRQALEATEQHARDERNARVFIASPAVRPDGVIQHECSDRSYIYEINFVTNKRGERELIVVGREASRDSAEFRKQWNELTGAQGIKDGALSVGDTGYEAVVEKGKRATGSQFTTKLAQGIISLTQNIPQYKGAVRYIDPYEAMKFPDKTLSTNIREEKTIKPSRHVVTSWRGFETFNPHRQERLAVTTSKVGLEVSTTTSEHNGHGRDMKTSPHEPNPTIAAVYREGPVASDFFASVNAVARGLFSAAHGGESDKSILKSDLLAYQNQSLWYSKERDEVVSGKQPNEKSVRDADVQVLCQYQVAESKKMHNGLTDTSIRKIANARREESPRSNIGRADRQILLNNTVTKVARPEARIKKISVITNVQYLQPSDTAKKLIVARALLRKYGIQILKKVTIQQIFKVKTLQGKVISPVASIKQTILIAALRKIKPIARLMQIQKMRILVAVHQRSALLQKRYRHIIETLRRAVKQPFYLSLRRNASLVMRRGIKKNRNLIQKLSEYYLTIRDRTNNDVLIRSNPSQVHTITATRRFVPAVFKMLWRTRKFAMKISSSRLEDFVLFLEQRRLYRWLLLHSENVRIIFARLLRRKRRTTPSVSVLPATKITIPETAL